MVPVIDFFSSVRETLKRFPTAYGAFKNHTLLDASTTSYIEQEFFGLLITRRAVDEEAQPYIRQT
jgi:hypothetical protein